MRRTKPKPPTAEELDARSRAREKYWEESRMRAERAEGHEQLVAEIRATCRKTKRPEIVFPDRETKLAWLAEGARTGVVPPLPDGAYYE